MVQICDASGDALDLSLRQGRLLLETDFGGSQLETPNLEGIALRYGFFYEPGTWFASNGDVANQVHQQQFPIVGNGEGVWSWLHIEDAEIATVAVVERGNPGWHLPD